MKEKIQEYKMVLIIVLMAIIGSTSTFFKIGLRELPIDLFIFLRFVFALIFLAPYFLKQKSEIVTNKKRLILISLVAAANVFLFIVGLQYTTAIISGMLYASVPLVTAAMSFLIIKEKVSLKKWLGILTGFFGVLVIIVAPLIQGTSIWNGTLIGNFIIIVAVFAFCLYSVLSKKYSNDYSPIVLTKYFFLTTLVMQSCFLCFHLESFSILTKIHLTTWLAVLYSGVLGTALYYYLYQYVIKKVSPILASMTFFLQPLAGIMWARLLIGEKITPIFFVGTIFIFLGMGVVFYEQYSNAKIVV